MTIETRTTIELKDINAFEFECPNCHTKTVRLLRERLNVAMACQNCDEGRFFLLNSQELASMQDFLALLKRYATAKTESFILRLEISGITEKEYPSQE